MIFSRSRVVFAVLEFIERLSSVSTAAVPTFGANAAVPVRRTFPADPEPDNFPPELTVTVSLPKRDPVTFRTPPEILVPPTKVLAPLRFSVPDPIFDRA